MKALTRWNQVQVKIRNTHAAVSFIALANLKAVSRALNAVFISIIFGIPARGVLCLVANHPAFPTIIDYSPQSIVVDGCIIVNLEKSLTHEEFLSIKEQSRCCVQVPQMRVSLEEYFPHCSFSSTMLYRMRDKFLKEKYGADGHNLPDLFMKGERI
jgi:hypothetical protein